MLNDRLLTCLVGFGEKWTLTNCLGKFMNGIGRNIELDILKGIMIIFVVIGHTNIAIPFMDVYWFHMRAFFLISGYLAKNKGSVKKQLKAI